MSATNPIWQRQQTAAMIGQPAKTSFYIVAAVIERSSKLVLQQCHRTQSSRTVSTMPQTVARSFPFSYQLMSRHQGNLVKRIAVVCLVAKDIAAPLESREQARSNLRFADVQRGNFPSQGQGSRSVHGMQLVSFGIAAARSAPGTIGVFAVTSDRQWFAVHDGNPTALSQLAQVSFHNIQEPLNFRRLQSAAHGWLRRQFSSGPKAFRPIFGLAGPQNRPFVQRGPKENHDDFDVKESGPASMVPIDQIFHRIGTMPTRVRVPCLISLKKGFN